MKTFYMTKDTVKIKYKPQTYTVTCNTYTWEVFIIRVYKEWLSIKKKKVNNPIGK